MKIAAACDDDLNISRHFEQAPYYSVVIVENGMIVGRETRGKMRASASNDDEKYRQNGLGPILDCQVLLAGGIEREDYETVQRCGIEPVVTDVGNTYEAVILYMKGKLPNLLIET
ncbi:MAG: NifB/NifX family molybdenum-iron cluster-binding protein [Dehalococcoidia bacterium]